MTTAHWILIALLPVAYLVGAVPFGLVVGLAKGVDPRKSGSGNIGATNLGRLLGLKFFLLVFFLDFLKGFLPVMAASIIVRRNFVNPDAMVFLLWLLVGFAAILGHMFSVFIGFKGGKGVATSCGVMFGLFPFFTWPGLACLVVWIALFAWSRIVSLASIIAAALFPVAFIVMGLCKLYPLGLRQSPLIAFALLVAFMIVYRHRSNITRLLAGTESSFKKANKK
jgi:glycerol-3-phosphate acyltransferase PlsY